MVPSVADSTDRRHLPRRLSHVPLASLSVPLENSQTSRVSTLQHTLSRAGKKLGHERLPRKASAGRFCGPCHPSSSAFSSLATSSLVREDDYIQQPPTDYPQYPRGPGDDGDFEPVSS